MPENPVPIYLRNIETDLRRGNATEYTYREHPEHFLEALVPGVTVTNEPQRSAVGAPDYVVTKRVGNNTFTIGYIEAKNVGADLQAIERDSERPEPATRDGKQLKRYRHGLPNLLLTDYLDFRWYTDGELRQHGRLAQVERDNHITRLREEERAVLQLLDNFLRHQAQPVTQAQDLARRMARLTHIIRDIIIEAIQANRASDLLRGWREAFAQVLISDLDQPEKLSEFADMFAQTLAYGLFSARIVDPTPGDFSRQEAQRLIPNANPFLRRFFNQIAGIEMDDEPYAAVCQEVCNFGRA